MKKIIIILVLLCIISLAVYEIPLPNKINAQLQGTQYRFGDPTYSEKITISMKGVYYRYLLKDNKFKGSITISSYDFTFKDHLFPLIFIRDNSAFLNYSNIKDGKPVLNSMGLMYCTPNLKQIIIFPYEPMNSESKSWSAEHGLMISAPSKNRAQAIDQAKKLTKGIYDQWIR